MAANAASPDLVNRLTLAVAGGGNAPQEILNFLQPPAKYVTAAYQSATFSAGDLTGAETICFENTGTTPGNLQTRTATQMFQDWQNAVTNLSWLLLIRNSSGSANTATITAGTGVTLNGTMTIAQNVTRTFLCTFTSPTALTIQSMGISAAGA